MSELMQWDPEVESPATVLVMGSDAVAVEAALYARFLGYAVTLAVEKRIGSELLLPDQPLAETWQAATSSLGRAALHAQGTDLEPSDDLSRAQFIERYLLPLAKTDLLYESVQINSPIRSICRVGCSARDTLSSEQRASLDFRVLIDSSKRGEYAMLADIVLDCTGFRRLPGLASGGGLAVGEHALRSSIATGEPGANAEGKHAMVYGRSIEALHCAQQCVVSGGKTTWIVPRRYGSPVCGDSDVLEEELSALRDQDSSDLVLLDAWGIEAISHTADEGWKMRVEIQTEETVEMQADQFFNVDARQADWGFAEQLPGVGRMLEKESGLTAEPHYYVLGPKSGGGIGALSDCREQIKKCFTHIGGREDLDLYQSMGTQDA